MYVLVCTSKQIYNQSALIYHFQQLLSLYKRVIPSKMLIHIYTLLLQFAIIFLLSLSLSVYAFYCYSSFGPLD